MRIKLLILLLFISVVGHNSQAQMAVFHSNNVTATVAASYDTDAQLFFDANTGLTTTIKDATNTLVTSLKANGLWTKGKAWYPYVGGTASAHKWNLKDPRDLDAAYRLTFGGTWTHSANGADPNGTTAYADTHLVPSTVLSLNSAAFGFYSRENVAEGCLIGSNNGNDYIYIRPRGTDDLFYGNVNSTSSLFGTVSNTNSQGLFSVSRINSTQIYVCKNSTSTTITSGSDAMPDQNIYFGARNNNGTAAGFSSQQIAFAFVADGLTTTELSTLYTIIQTFETSLSRQL